MNIDFNRELDWCVEKVKRNAAAFGDKFPSACGKGGDYIPLPNASEVLGSDWTSSFYTGMIWLAYERSGDEQLYKKGLEHIESFAERLENRDITGHHDLGFLYILSCGAPYVILRNKRAKEIFIKAAYMLTERFQEKAGILQQNYPLDDRDNPFWGRFIIDSLMNLPLLYRAAEFTGDEKLYDIALTHLKNVLKYILREDGGTYQVARKNPMTGELIEQTTAQGAGKNACWARGQAWAVYGLCLSYKFTGISECVEKSIKAADFFLERLPKDLVCAWDLCYTDEKTQKDSSAAAVLVCGLLELSKLLPPTDSRKTYYENKAREILAALAALEKAPEKSNALLIHGVYSLPGNLGIDEPQIYGDYYYMEALTRMCGTWRSYWGV